MNRPLIANLTEKSQDTSRFSQRHYEWTGSACLIGNAIIECKNAGLMHLDVAADDHVALAGLLSIPVEVLYVGDFFFEKVTDFKEWPARFWRALALSSEPDAVPRKVAYALSAFGFRKSPSDRTRILSQNLIEFFNSVNSPPAESRYQYNDAKPDYKDCIALASLTEETPNIRSCLFWFFESYGKDFIAELAPIVLEILES